ncbi:MAG TPA: spermine synthase, partial [Gammaproteobacteria bacterium]
VHSVARDWFALPEEPRLTLHFGDGGTFMREADAETYSDYDLVLVDAFEAMGIADSVCSSLFFDACRARLADKGMMAINLWSRDRLSLDHILNYLADSFSGEMLRLPVGGKENVIALAGNLPGLKKRLKQLGERAETLERQMAVEFPLFLRTLRKSNRSFFF